MRLALARPTVAWRSPRLPLGVAAVLLGGSLLAMAAAWLIGTGAAPHYRAVPRVDGVVPLVAPHGERPVALFGLDSPSAPPPALPQRAADPLAPPLDADPALTETIAGLVLPIVAADGRLPRQVYARRPPALIDGRPVVAVVVVDLGLDAERLAQSVELPAELGLAHTPYAAYLPAWQRHARWHGHEVLLELPLQAADHPHSDLGPWALHPARSPGELVDGLSRILSRSEGFIGVSAASEAFAAAPERFAPIAAELALRGLGLVELGPPLLAATATANGVAHVAASGPLDAVLDPAAIDSALARLEAEARRDGRAVGYAQPYPLTFDRLWHWARELDARGLTLVPVSALLGAP